MGSGTFPEITVCEHSSLSHPQIRVKALYPAKKPYVNMIQEPYCLLWAKVPREVKQKTVLWSGKSKFEIAFGKRFVLQIKQKNHPACCQHLFKCLHLMVWGCINACGIGSLHIWKGTINAERHTQALEQHVLPFTSFLGIFVHFSKKMLKRILAAITTAWLHNRRVQVLNWPACNADITPAANIWSMKQKT